MPIPSSIDTDGLWRFVGEALRDTQVGAPGLVASFFPGSWMVTCDVASWTANWFAVYGIGPGGLATARAWLDRIQAEGRPTSVVVREPVRDQVAPLLAGRPIHFEGNPPLMWRGAEPFPPNPRPYAGTVRRVSAGSDVRAAIDVISRAFGTNLVHGQAAVGNMLASPAVRLHVAESDGLDSVCVTWRSGTVVYVYLLASDPGRQRRGAGREVLVQAMAEHIADGAEVFWLLASDAGRPLYNALGFETFERPDFWVMNPQE